MSTAPMGARVRRPPAFPVAVFLAALILRLVPVLLTLNLGIGLDDMFQYDMLGRSLAAGNGFRWYAPADLARLAPYLHLAPSALSADARGVLTTFRAPLYPALIAGLYMLFGTGPTRFIAVRIAQAALGALLAPLTYFCARLACGPIGVDPPPPGLERSSRAAALAVAVYPMLIVFPLGLVTENLFFPLVLGSVLVLLDLARVSAAPGGPHRPVWSATGWRAGLAGLLLGACALTRSVILPFAAAAMLWIAFGIKQRRAAFLAMLCLTVTILPWIVRNSLVSGRITGIETSLGYNLYVGYHPQSSGTFTFGPSLDLLSILDDKTRDAVATSRAVGFIEQDPARVPYLALRRLGYFFNLEWRAFTYFYANGFLGRLPAWVLTLILTVLGIPFVALGLSAAFGWAVLPNGPQPFLLQLLFLSYLLPHVFILSEERFRLTLIPIFAIWAAAVWAQGLRGLWRKRAAAWISVAFALLLLFNWGFQLVTSAPILEQLLGPSGSRLYLPY